MSSNHTIKDNANGISDQLKGLVGAGHDTIIEVKDKVIDAKDIVVARAESLFSTLNKSIKAHPAIAAGVGIGLVVGIGYLAIRLIRR